MNHNSCDLEARGESVVSDTFESGSGIPRDDGIDYLWDVNAALEDIINLFKGTLEGLEQSLSRKPEPTEERSQVCHEDSMNVADSVGTGSSKAAYHFLKKLKFLIEQTEKQIKVSPTEKQEQDRKLRRAIRSSGRTEMEIKCTLKESLQAQRTEHEKLVGKLIRELNDCVKSSRRRAEELKNETERIVNESESKMAIFYKESVARAEMLKSEIKSLETRLNNLRRANIIAEKELGAKRCRVEHQLLDTVAKYDEEIGGRHREMENLAKEYGLLNSQRKTLEEDVMVNLRKLHDDLQKEKAEALQKILNERVENFVRNRAARVIQRAWRAYWERHCAKKKKKSRKK